MTDTRNNIAYDLNKILQAIVRVEQGDDGFTYHDYKGNPLPKPDPEDWSAPLAIPEVADPLLRLELAQLIRAHTVGLVRDAVTAARAWGLPWSALADALKVDKAAPDRDVLAFETAVPEGIGLWRERVLYWKCGTCNERIKDTGPYAGYPDDCEEGHAETCVRMQAEIAEYERVMGDNQ